MKRLILSTMLILVMPVVLLAQDWVEHIITDDLNGVNSIQCIDVDGDSAIDVLSTNINLPSYVSWWKNDGNGNFTMHAIDSSTSTTNLYLEICGAQLDEDEFADILVASRATISCWMNDGNENFSKYVIGTNFKYCFSLFAAHVNADEYMDVLGASSENDDIFWWENLDGSGTNWQEHPIDTFFDGARSVYAMDINGDNATDVIGAAFEADAICWWENMGGDPLTFTKHTITADFDGANSVFAADIDDDGDADVLGAAKYADDICWWENLDGSGMSWEEHHIDTLFEGVESVIAIDMNGDNVMDILAGGSSLASVGPGIAYWINDGDENFTKYTVDSDIRINDICAIDLDNDEDIDVIGASYYLNDLIWWENVLSEIDDVGPYSIDIPDIVPLDTTLYPQVTVMNYGTETERVRTTCTIEPGGYMDMAIIHDLAPGACEQITFSDSFNFEDGFYTVTVYTTIMGAYDENHSNDTLGKVITAFGIAEEDVCIPKTFNLTAPTISNSKSNITLALPQATKIDLVVYDASGRLCEKLVSGRFSAGIHSIPVEFDLPAGVYFYNLKTVSGDNIIKKFLLIE